VSPRSSASAQAASLSTMHVNVHEIRPNHETNYTLPVEHSWVLSEGVSDGNIATTEPANRFKNVDKLLVELENKVIYNALPALDPLMSLGSTNRELFYHVVSFKFTSEMTPEKLRVFAQLIEDCARIDGVVSLMHGDNKSSRGNGYTHVRMRVLSVVAQLCARKQGVAVAFTNADAFQQYFVHPVHKKLLDFATPMYQRVTAMVSGVCCACVHADCVPRRDTVSRCVRTSRRSIWCRVARVRARAARC
jgi:hypothetical protein